MSPPQCGPISVSSQSEASDKASVCQAWRRCGVVSAAIPLSQQSNSATSMVVPIASQASTIVDTNNQRHVSFLFLAGCRSVGGDQHRGPHAMQGGDMNVSRPIAETARH